MPRKHQGGKQVTKKKTIAELKGEHKKLKKALKRPTKKKAKK